MTPEQGKTVLEILKGRDGIVTTVELSRGPVFEIMNIAWGQDIGADFDHITTDISPTIEGRKNYLFHTSEVSRILDERGSILFEMP